jgi:hypothetical protein
MARARHSQLILVIPKSDIVIAMTGFLGFAEQFLDFCNNIDQKATSRSGGSNASRPRGF